MKKPMNSSPRVSKDPLTQQTPKRRRVYHGDDTGKPGDLAKARAASKKAPAKKPAPKKAPKAAKAETPAPADPTKPVIPEHREDIQAPYHFTPEEIAAMNVGLRTALDDIETLESQAKAAAQDFKLRITNKRNEVKQYRNKLTAGEETRPMKAAVEFLPKKSVKRYLHPETGEFIREEAMQPADWQLPMFKPEEIQSPKPPATPPPAAPQAPAKAAKPSPAGETSMSDALNKAAGETKAPQFWIDLSAGDWSEKGLIDATKKIARKAGWSAPQVSALADVLKGADGVPAMIATLRPYVIAPEDHFVEVPAEPGADATTIKVARVETVIADGFPLEKITGTFRKAAKQAEWPDGAIDAAVNEAERQSRVIGDEPEATEAAANYLRSFTVPK